MSFRLMGIINVTPDSFYDGGRAFKLKDALRKAERMVEEGADILDVGGESSRPGSDPVSAIEEKKRVLPVVKAISRCFKNIKISVDTVNAEVARASLGEGASIINDITALRGDSEMVAVVREFKPDVVLMHMQGSPKTMQKAPRYKNVVNEVKHFLRGRMDSLIEEGIPKKSLWIDPGIGFGKTVGHNLELLHSLDEFCDLEAPIVVGCSRKSFIGKILGDGSQILDAKDRLEGSLACACWAYLKGASILRVHDVRATRRALSILTRIIQLNYSG